MNNHKKKENVFPPLPISAAGIVPLPVPPIVTDPNGSYTGRPLDPAERPIQDADDL